VPDPDPYWSRRGRQGELAERQDPVLWGDEPGPLSAAQRAAYGERGFLVMPALLGAAEVADLLAEAERLAAVADRGRDDVIVEPEGDAVRSLFRVHRTSPVLARLAGEPRLAGVARQLLGGDVYLHQSRINFKPAFEGKAFPWHSDFETWHLEDGMPRMRALSVSILLTVNTEHNGPLLLVPGSHRTYVRCVGETPPEHFRQSLRRQQYGVPDRAALTELVRRGGLASGTGPAGTVVFFDCNTMHGSAGNLTPWPRHNVFFVYNSTANRLVAPFGGTPPRPDFLAERAPAGLAATP
jgi:ectoine hydroxylase